MNAPLPKTVDILGQQITRIEFRGEQVATFSMIDKLHKRPDGTSRRTFNSHKQHLVKGHDYHEINQPDVIRTLGITRPQGGTPSKVVLMTMCGYMLLTKPFEDDLSWQAQREMVNRYFIVEDALSSISARHDGARSDQQEFMFEEDGLQFFRAEVTRSGNEVTRTLEGVKLAIIGYVKKAISPSLLALSDKMQDFRDRTGRGLNTVNNNVKAVQGQIADLNAKFSPSNGDMPIIMSEWYGCGRIYRDLYGMDKMPRQGMLSAAVTRSLDAFVLRSRQNFNMTMFETNTAPSRAWHIDAVRPWFDQIGKRMIDQHVSNHSAPLFERKQS